MTQAFWDVDEKLRDMLQVLSSTLETDDDAPGSRSCTPISKRS